MEPDADAGFLVDRIAGEGRYDDREHEAFGAVQGRVLRFQLAFLAGDVVAYVLLVTLARPLVEPGSVAWLVVNLFAWLSFAFVFLSMALLPKRRYYVIDGGILEYPRFGYTQRFGLSLREVPEYRREGNGSRKRIVLLSPRGKRRLDIAESDLADPDAFAQTLRFWRVRETDAKVVRVARR